MVQNLVSIFRLPEGVQRFAAEHQGRTLSLYIRYQSITRLYSLSLGLKVQKSYLTSWWTRWLSIFSGSMVSMLLEPKIFCWKVGPVCSKSLTNNCRTCFSSCMRNASMTKYIQRERPSVLKRTRTTTAIALLKERLSL